MIRETEFSRRFPREWLLTPNFERLVLGLVRDRISINTQNISQNLVEAKKDGKDHSFPPNFDPNSLKDIREILLHLEKQRFLMHISDRAEGDFWALSMKGYELLRDHRAREEKSDSREETKQKPIKERRKIGRKRKLKIRKKDQDRAREAKQVARAEQIRAEEKEREDRKERAQAEKIRKREEKRIAKEARQTQRIEAARSKKTEKLERKEEPRVKKEKGRAVGDGSQSKDHKKEPVVFAKAEVIRDPLLRKLENEFRDACKRLRDHKYRASLPLFKEGDDSDGMQVYFSAKGYLCYLPKETEFPIDLDIALDIYGYEKISKALTQVLQMRHF